MKLYDAEEAAKEIGCTPRTLRRNAAEKNIGKKAGTSWVFTAEQLEELRGVVRGTSGNPNYGKKRTCPDCKGKAPKMKGCERCKGKGVVWY